MKVPPRAKAFDLEKVRRQLLDFFAQRQDPGGLHGAYRPFPRRRCDLYSSCDAALIRVIMGEDFRRTLTAKQRKEWCEHINSFAAMAYGRSTGEYTDTFGHHALHAHGMVIGALGPLGGRMPAATALYEPFADVETVVPWLESLDWSDLWHASHLFWGGLHCFSFSRQCSPAWLQTVHAWLEANLDPVTGWWRRGVAHQDRHQGLGGGAHIWPIYEHHGWTFPLPRQVIDSTLSLQLPAGNWRLPGGRGYRGMDYLDLDALYALRVMGRFAPEYRRDDVIRSVRRYGQTVRAAWERDTKNILSLHPHYILAATGILGLLNQLLPDEWAADTPWTDIFSDRRLYQTEAVSG